MSEADADRTSEFRNPDSFRTLVEEHKRSIYFLALDLSGNHHDAEDLSQEVFIKAHGGLDSFRGEASTATWLRRITVNTFLNKRRKKALRFMQLFENGEEDMSEQSHFVSPEARTEEELLHQHINRALVKLSPAERSAFVLRHLNDLAVNEIAETMAVADGTVKSLLFRATKKMQASLSFYRADKPEIQS
jgi:RNA polymerase sigma-70 factor (ECF subfamily)